MKITVAEHAGFCFGVKRAVDLVEQLLAAGGKVCTLGPIIHNPQVVEDFAARGVYIAQEVQDVPAGYRVVCRSHGVTRQVIEQMEARAVPYIDAICPFVAKIHQIVQDAAGQGRAVLVAGDQDHPEVQAILSRCGEHCFCFSQPEQLEAYASAHPESRENPCVLVAQTTFNAWLWEKCVATAKKMYTNSIIFDTICNATILRQNEADCLSRQCDWMVVVGGKNSSNTAKLKQICEANCPTLHVERPEELLGMGFGSAHNIGVTAGASTPVRIIKEVQRVMSDVVKQDELSFEEMLEQSFKTINTRERVTGVVTGISANEIAVDIGTKHAGYVPLDEYTNEPNAKLDELVKVGDELELLVLRLNDVEGTAMLSKKRLDAIAGFEKIVEAEEAGQILDGKIVDVVKGGVIALAHGVRVFIPASQATLSRGQDLETLRGQTACFKILETNRGRRRAVGSIRAVLKEQRKEQEEQFWQSVAAGSVYSGTVKSLTSYGAFIDLGGVDGMVHISELSWSRIKHPSEVVSIGDQIEVYVKDIDSEVRKISLGYKKTEDNPWEVLAATYKVGDTAAAKIVSMTAFGAFAQILPGVDGLIHISQISNERVNKPQDVLAIGQEVEVKITDIDFEKKRVSLSMRALLEPAPEAQPAEETDEVVHVAAPPQETPTEEAAPEAPAQEEPTEE